MVHGGSQWYAKCNNEHSTHSIERIVHHCHPLFALVHRRAGIEVAGGRASLIPISEVHNMAMDSDKLLRLILGCLLFRLGGEQTFTEEEIDFICADVKGIQISTTADGKLLLRTRNPETVAKAIEKGKIL